jgi:hypothetical protein
MHREVQLEEFPRNTMRLMRSLPRARVWTLPAIAPAVIALAAIAITGCGGGTKTVSVASSPPATQTTNTTASTNTTSTPANTTTSTTGTTATSTTPSTPAGTRTAPAPAFAEKEKSAGASTEGLPAAMAVVRAHGYTASDTSDYHSAQTLRVLVGTGSHSNDGYDKQAFFFVDGRYLGTDTTTPSAQLSVVSQGDTEVTLAYALYRANDPLCCPGGGQAKVTFQLNNGHLIPLNPIPPVNASTGLSRQ